MGTTNLGNQHVSISPYQSLDSVNGNQILYKVIEPGVYNAQVSISETFTTLEFTVKEGSTLAFYRTGVTSSGDVGTYNMVCKVVLGTDATFSAAKADVFSYNVDKLYIIADFLYDKDNPSAKFADFSLTTTPPQASDLDCSSVTHKLLVATILNQQAVRASGPSYNVDLYHISYDSQKHRSYFSPLINKVDNFALTYAGDGDGITVAPGEVFVGNRLFRTDAATSLALAGVYQEVYNKETGEWTTIDLIALGLDYYQVDFLRVKRNETTETLELGWDSFAVLKDGFVYDFNTYATSKADLKDYLATIDFPFQNDGHIIAIVLRNYTQREMWPENTIVMYEETEIPASMSSGTAARSSVPTYNSTDITGLV